jgi:hypothetical protein
MPAVVTAPRRFDREGLAVAAVLLLAPWVVLSPQFVFRAELDAGDGAFARLAAWLQSAHSLLAGELLWTPESWLGQRLLGVPAFATLYLPKLILVLGNPAVAYAFYLLLHHVLAELGAYLYLTNLGCGRLAALFGALSYAFAGCMLDHREQNLLVVSGAWLPLVLFFFERAAARGTRWAYFGAAATFAMLPFSGAWELAVYLGGLLLLLSAARSLFEKDPRSLFALALAFAPALLVSALELVPFVDFARDSPASLLAAYDVRAMQNVLTLPALWLPLPAPRSAIDVHAGVLVVCAVAVAVARVRSAPALLRAWLTAASLAFVVLLARLFPPTAQLLHGLPVLGAPGCDQLVLVLSLAVLGAWGFEQARARGGGRLSRWLVVGAGVGALSWLALWVAGNSGQRLTDARRIWQQTSWLLAAGALAPFLLWTLALKERARPLSRALWAAVALGPALEATFGVHANDAPRDAHAVAVEAPRRALAGRKPPSRVLTSSPVGDMTLLAPGVQSLFGVMPVDATTREVFGVDAHGRLESYEDLAFSALPSLCGVTHVVLPAMVCAAAEQVLPDERELCAGSGSATPRSVASSTAACTALFTEMTPRYRLQAELRAAAPDAGAVVVGFWGTNRNYPDFALYVDGRALGAQSTTHARGVSLLDAAAVGYLGHQNHTRHEVTFRKAGLYAERGLLYAYPSDERGAVLAPGADTGERFHLPRRAFEIVLDAEAPAKPEGPATFGLELENASRTRVAWRLRPDELGARRRTRHVAFSPPDLRKATLFVRVEGSRPLVVHRLSATDACAERGYRRLQRLGEGLFLYENPASVPRAYAVGEAVQVASAAEARRSLLDFRPSDIGKKAVVLGETPRELREGVVQTASIASREAEVTVKSDQGPTLLVMNDRYDSSWRATIDGKPAPMLRVNGMLRGLLLPRGVHRARFVYVVPRSVWIGLALAVAGMLGALLAAPALHARRLGASPTES